MAGGEVSNEGPCSLTYHGLLMVQLPPQVKSYQIKN